MGAYFRYFNGIIDMKKLLLFAALLGLFGCQTTYYVVRHAEKAAEPRQDPPLTQIGTQRAENLKQLMRSKKIEKVFSTNYLRTKNTDKPAGRSYFNK